MAITLSTPIAELSRVGKAAASRLRRLHIETVEDLLHHYPRRYEDYSETRQIADVKVGDEVTVRARVELIDSRRSPRKRMMVTEAMVKDASDSMRVVWFRQPYVAKQLKVGDIIYLSGKIKEDMVGLTMHNPTYEKEKEGKTTTHTARIVPIYPATFRLTQKQLRYLIRQSLPAISEIEEWIPEEIMKKHDLMPLAKAINVIHQPESNESVIAATRRLKFSELFLLQLRGEMIRRSLRQATAPTFHIEEEKLKAFTDALPFSLTTDQKKAAWNILQDMQEAAPMNRLLEGDVGSGKTVVAALVAHNVCIQGAQVVVMAPTEILANQHHTSLLQYLGKDHRVGLLTANNALLQGETLPGRSKKARREALVDAVKQGEVDIIIGTHALLTDDVSFQQLGLVIVDEQHRFGVEQRKTLRDRSGDPDTVPHFLSMTATPIPRSFALALYGDLDISIIKEMPAGRKVIKTRLVEPANRDKAYAFIDQHIEQGRQVFVICPLIDDQGDAEKKSVLAEYETLSSSIFKHRRVAMLHGKMKPKEKDAVMQAFAAGESDILVSTSVVEVGVNVPNATVMMIEGAERFGLAQLHQFRGRVGRSDHQSFCFLFTDSTSDAVTERLSFFEATSSGFDVAEFDLQHRGPGDVYGTTQSGMQQLRLATLQDHDLIRIAREEARALDFDAYPAVMEQVAMWEERVHLE